jgi:MinD-like ATPase involved in chromosome partitioning or flagellar assembly
MTRTVAVHSHHGGTGKSRLAAAGAGLLAASGRRVGLVDTALQSPSLHRLFGLRPPPDAPSLARFLRGRCEAEEAAYDVSDTVGGPLLLVPSALDPADTDDLLLTGYDFGLLADACLRLASRFALDLLLLDTHPGRSGEAKLGVTLADAVALVVRPDALGIGEELATGPDRMLVLNMVPAGMDPDQLRRRLPDSADPVAMVPYSRALEQRDRPGSPVPDPAEPLLSRELRKLAAALAG